MALSHATFDYVSDLVRRRSAIQLPPGKEYLVEARLTPLAREAGFEGPSAVNNYIAQVRTKQHPAQLVDICEALTTNETSWFRDNTPFKVLTEDLVPQLVTQGPNNLKIWSAACSTGQEPYSIAMSLLDMETGPSFSIVATDISRAVLVKARQGAYSQLEMNRGMPAPLLVRYFERQGHGWQINQHIRSKVNFLEHNLMSTPPGGGPFDIVFIRNVLIYFDLATKRDVLRRVARVMRPGGFLMLGAAETTMGMDPVWNRVNLAKGSVYQLQGGGAK